MECLKTFNLHQYEPNEKGGGVIFDGKILTYVHDQGGSRLPEFRKIPEEICRKSTTFSVNFCKKYKNQWQKLEHSKFQWVFAKFKNIC